MINKFTVSVVEMLSGMKREIAVRIGKIHFTGQCQVC